MSSFVWRRAMAARKRPLTCSGQCVQPDRREIQRVTIARSSAPRGGLACHSAFNEAPVAFNEAPVDSVDLVCRVEQKDIQALHRARQRGGREGTLSVRNNPAIRGLVGWRAYMCAPA